MEKRILIAFVLSAVIFAVWTVLFPPPKPAPRQQPIQREVVVEEGIAEPDGFAEATNVESETEGVEITAAVEGKNVESVVIENDVVRVEFSNQGAVITSLVLKRYEGDDKSPLEIIQTVDSPQRTLPLQLVIKEHLDKRLYEIERLADGVEMRWSDGLGSAVEKRITLGSQGYSLDVAVHLDGGMQQAAMSIGTGMRDTSMVERKNRFATWGDVTVSTKEDRETYKREKTKEEVVVSGSGLQFAGMEDTYFLEVFRPHSPIEQVRIVPVVVEETTEDGKVEELNILRIDLLGKGGLISGELFAAPKEYDLLTNEDQGLQDMLHFGIFHPIAVFFLKILRWIYGFVGNWGTAIVLLTIAIRIALFPLMHKSTVSMRRMQKVQPKVKAIQEKYKKSKSDPQVRAKMNQETMALYKEEGVNPMGGCLPILVQMPILFALYTLFAHAIELRHAPFIWWITDLSAKDPLYITPVLMTATMWLQQRLAPQAGDPQQMRIMRVMPLVFGVMFLGFPSGLVLYWLTNNVVSIIQQEITLHMIGERGGKRGKRGALAAGKQGSKGTK